MSAPLVRRNAQVTEWLMVADCKSAALRSYGGSNPPLCTRIFDRERTDGAAQEVLDRAALPVNGLGGWVSDVHVTLKQLTLAIWAMFVVRTVLHWRAEQIRAEREREQSEAAT